MYEYFKRASGRVDLHNTNDIVYGGFLWMTAHGNEEQVTKAKNLITAALIGLVIILSAYAISVFVISKLGQGTLSETTQAE